MRFNVLVVPPNNSSFFLLINKLRTEFAYGQSAPTVLDSTWDGLARSFELV